MNWQPLTVQQIGWRAAQDLDEGMCVNVGIGMPTAVLQYVPRDKEVIFQTENGVVGVGPPPEQGEEDPDFIVPGKLPATLVTGGCFIQHVDAFVMIRGGHIDVSLMGAFQVSARGDLANWITDPEAMPAIGGAMDLAAGARSVRVLMRHTTKSGQPKIVPECTYPLTGKRCVKRIYTDLCVIDASEGRLQVSEVVPGLTPEELQARTGATLHFGEGPGLLEVPAPEDLEKVDAR